MNHQPNKLIQGQVWQHKITNERIELMGIDNKIIIAVTVSKLPSRRTFLTVYNLAHNYQLVAQCSNINVN